MNIHEEMAEKLGLAVTYAQDGAFYSAARVLRELASGVFAHAEYCDPTKNGEDADHG